MDAKRPLLPSAELAGGAQPSLTAHQVIQCANCGGYGHVYRVCNLPISSFGIICFRSRPQGPQYLMVQRKDSLCYVEFVRGKYNLQNRGYILKLLSNMTAHERERLCTNSFDELWYGFWQCDHTRSYMKEYEQSSSRFATLKSGYYLRPCSDPSGEHLEQFSLQQALGATTPTHDETEYGFPKGRRNINETDMRCACREFKEETGMDMASICVISNVRPFEEVFTGSNRVRYRHVYYLARQAEAGEHWGEEEEEDPVSESSRLTAGLSPAQQREVRSVGWYDADGVLQRIRHENLERREMFRRVHAVVQQLLTAGGPAAAGDAVDEGPRAGGVQ